MADAHKMVGGPTAAPAGRENDLEIIELARYAVADHNARVAVAGVELLSGKDATLEFVRVVKATHQVVAGTLHHLTIEVKEADGGKKLYQAKVQEKKWEDFKQLQSFQPVVDAAAA